jgi:hypothetical protein
MLSFLQLRISTRVPPWGNEVFSMPYMDYLVLIFVFVVAFLGCFIWDSIIDGTARKKPSDWLGYSYLASLATVVGYAFKYLDEIRAHPYLSSIIGAFALAVIGWLTVLLWRKAEKWDQSVERKRRG